MNGVDRSDQLIGTNNVMRKCLRWWKTLFFHLIDIAYCSAPQCCKYLHATREKNCFLEWHNGAYHE